MTLEITDEFVVPLAVEDAWVLLTNVERIAPCLPGARLDVVEDGAFLGVVRVKVGPITVEYKGSATFSELDVEHHRLILKASGRETRGQGNASATVSAALFEDGRSTKVELRTDLDVTGKVAQFGRGVLTDVSARLLRQFVKNLEADLIAAGRGADSSGGGVIDLDSAGDAATAPAPGRSEDVAPRAMGSGGTEAEPINLGRLIGGSVGRKLVPGFLLVFVAATVRWIRRRRS